MSERQIVEIPIAEIRPSSTNPRRTFDEAKLQELAASIREHGVQTPVLVRWWGGESSYQLVYGARRLRASELAGKVTVPCEVREMTDAEARDAQIIENLQRADVDPVEEAQAFGELLEASGSIAAVAARVGKEQSYIAKSLRLNALTLPSSDALRARLITIDHALLLARLAETEQNAALKWTLDHSAGAKMTVEKVLEERLARVAQEAEDRKEAEAEGERRFRHYTWEPQSVVKLKAWIEAESGILLSRAPWSLTEEDYLLPDVGPCSECPKNTKANAPLFGDLVMGEATCTDGACFAAKTAGFVQIEMRKAGHDEQAKPKVLVPRLSWKASSVKPSVVPNDIKVIIETPGRCGETANPAKVLKQGQWIEAKPGSCVNVRPGVTCDWSDDGQRGYMGDDKKLRKPGEVLQVCIAVGCKTHRKEWEKPKAAGNTSQRPDPAAQKKAEEEAAHVEKIEREIRAKILFAILGKLDATKAVRLVADKQQDAAGWRKRILAVMPELGGETLEAFIVFCSEFAGYFHANSYWLMQQGGVAESRKHVFALAKSVGLDGAQIAAKHFHDGGIAPWSERLYPKGVPWPKGEGSPAKKAMAKKTAAKKAVAKKPTLTPERRKKIAAEMKKRLAGKRKAQPKAKGSRKITAQTVG
ncbi:ParB/RepB/Spo0J family partition protein [Bryocella elongata]|uniref:ParB/RepB/Spo0J family partition protein n=1 Tax=Bryocella elongata TaxID=863522 RepID=A0A1H6B561_9BACT|nr:ParB/RepB/Spo0J family partition protein [Bryocella elongata]SEG55991.1 ParB/RepB/Spo0J family partition protein [Bryocella elongata]